MEVKLDLAGLMRQKDVIGQIHGDLMAVSSAMSRFREKLTRHASMALLVGKVDLIQAELEGYGRETALLERVLDDAATAYTLLTRAMEQRADVLGKRIAGYDTRLVLMTHFIPPSPCADLRRIHERLSDSFADAVHAWSRMEGMTTAPLLKSDGGVLPDWLVDQARNPVGKGITIHEERCAEVKIFDGPGVPYALDDWFGIDATDAAQFAAEGHPVIVISEDKKDTGSGIRILVPKIVGDIPEIHAVTEIANEDGCLFYVHA